MLVNRIPGFFQSLRGLRHRDPLFFFFVCFGYGGLESLVRKSLRGGLLVRFQGEREWVCPICYL